MSSLSRISTSLIFLLAATHAHANAITGFAPEFSVTDLGPGTPYDVAHDGKSVSYVSASDGTQYAFEKSPVQVTRGGGEPGGWANTAMYSINLKSGSYQASDTVYNRSPLVQGSAGSIIWDSVSTSAYGTSLPGGLPIADINIRGQVVGYNDSSGGAAFSLPGLEEHPYVPKPLNSDSIKNYVTELPPFPGRPEDLWLRNAFAIDDLGRILVYATDGADYNHVYLFTPLALGDPTPVPEPTTLMMGGVLGIAYGLRRFRRRNG